LSVEGDFTYDFIHGVGSADSIAWSTGTTQNYYYKINTTAFVSHEADGLTIAGDSIQILTAGDYFINIALAVTTSVGNDIMRVKLFVNNAASIGSIGRWAINSEGAGLADASNYFWYKTFAANDWLSIRISNLSAARAMVVQDMKIYIEKKPE